MGNNQPSLEQINKMDVTAFRALYKEYYKALVGYAIQIVGEVEAAEDIVQGLFTNLWEKKQTFRSMISLKTYLFNSVRNASLDYIKHKNIESNYLQKMSASAEEFYWDENEANDIFGEEIYRLLFQTIDELPQRCREVFMLAMKGKKNEEISMTLQVSLETVKTQKKRGMSYLRDKLDNRSMILLSSFLF